MTVLGIDTATTVATVGVVRDGRAISEVSECSQIGHASGLPDLTSTALRRAGIRIGDVDAIAVSLGPGSFTGLRVGLAFAKGIAFCGGCRLVGVSTLEALAAAAPVELDHVAAATDARRGETYLALFRRRGEHDLERASEDLALPPKVAVERILAEQWSGASWGVVGDAAERYQEAFAAVLRRGGRIVAFAEARPRGAVVAGLGERRLHRGCAAGIEALVPVYVRASAAERNLRNPTLTTGKSVS